MLAIHELLLVILEAKDFLEFGLKLALPSLLLLWHKVCILGAKLIASFSLSPCISSSCCCSWPILGLLMVLLP
jgi:hypothetical protein